MWWFALWTVVAGSGVAGMIASANTVRFSRRVASDMASVRASAKVPTPPDLRRLADLPAPVRRYLAAAIGPRSTPIATVGLRHRGSFRPSPSGGWLPIEGRQVFTADPPAFVWWGRVRIVPGVWIDARDRSVAGSGNMLVMAESTWTLADSRGPELDQSALLRLLGELAWLPTAYLDPRYIQWAAVDDRHANATFTVGGQRVTGSFEFGDDGLPAVYRADRYRDTGDGRAVLTPFVGRTSDFRSVDGVLVPFRVAGSWIIDGQPFEYARFDVAEIRLDEPGR